MASISCVLNTLIVLITSFILSRQRFQGRTLLMKAMMVIGMFPGAGGKLGIVGLNALLVGQPFQTDGYRVGRGGITLNKEAGRA